MKLITINKNIITITINSKLIKTLTFPNNFKAIQNYIDITN